MEERDERFMELALELAALGKGFTSPNPAVGALLVLGDRTVGTGYHHAYGEEHAEELALANVDAKGGELFVTLEPHQFEGKRPPCTKLIIERGVSRVVVAALDPNPLVRGKGMEVLRAHGVTVEVGLLAERTQELNKGYFKFHETGRPFVNLKLALTLDGFIADHTGTSRWISCEASRRLVHRWRGEHDGVLVGIGTVTRDNPSLAPTLVRPGREPTKFVIDSKLRIKRDARVFSRPPVVVVCSSEAREGRQRKIEALGAKVWRCGDGQVSFRDFLDRAGREGYMSLLVEGGWHVASSLIAEDLVDEFNAFVAPSVLGSGISPFGELGAPLLETARKFKVNSLTKVEEDVLISLVRHA